MIRKWCRMIYRRSSRVRKKSYQGEQKSADFKPCLEPLEARVLLTFFPTMNFEAGKSPAAVAVGDFNNDGIPDLAVASPTDTNLSILLGNGDGTFKAPIKVAIGSTQHAVAVGDFNEDTKADLVVATDAGVSVLFGVGNGTFGSPVATGVQGNRVTVADFNLDKHQDLAITNFGGSSVTVMLGDGTGSFPTSFLNGIPSGPDSIVSADFNIDGRPDLVTSNFNNNSISVLLGNADGTFKTAVNYATDQTPVSVAVADFNGDTTPDIVTANMGSGDVSLFVGNGDGTFKAAKALAVGKSPVAVATGDFNGDGKMDLAVTDQTGAIVSIYLGNGNGTFQAPVNYSVGAGPNNLVASDLNNDSKPDLVTTDGNNANHLVSVLLNRPTSSPLTMFATGAGPGGGPQVNVYDAAGNLKRAFYAYDSSFMGGVHVAIGDVTGDGIPDIVTAPGPGAPPEIKVFDGLTGALVQDFMAFDSHFVGGAFVAVGEFDGDTKADIVVGAGAGGGPHVKVFSGADGHVIDSFYAYDPAFPGGVRVAVGDVNKDGTPDIITGAGPGGGPHVKVFDGTNINHVLDSFYAYDPNFSGGVFVAAGDINSDGHADVVTGAGFGGGPHVEVFSGLDGSILQSFYAFNANFTGGVRVGVLGDVNADGGPDLVVAPGEGSTPTVKLVDGLTGELIKSGFAYDSRFKGGVYVGGF